MSDNEKNVAKEIMDSLNAVPTDILEFVRGYLKGRVDGCNAADNKEV